MDRFIRIAAYILNALLILASLYLMTEAYDRDLVYCFLLILPPLFSILALKTGPDLEERRLTREVNKARLRAELDEVSGAAER